MTLSIIDTIAPDRTRYTTKPCPFCGADPLPAHRALGKYLVGCPNEDCHVCPETASSSLSEVWQKWNTRTVSPDVTALLTALRNCSRELEAVWKSAGQINPNRYVVEARAAIAKAEERHG